jgi:hypothetical protein
MRKEKGLSSIFIRFDVKLKVAILVFKGTATNCLPVNPDKQRK